MDKQSENGFYSSLSTEDKAIIEYLPYLLQDFESFSLTTKDADKLLKGVELNSDSRVLELACGKGAVSVHLAKKHGCSALGIDMMKEFIDYANGLAVKKGVSDKCSFKVGDVNEELKSLKDFDLVIITDFSDVVGGREPVKALKTAVKRNGYLILDDAYEDCSIKLKFEDSLKNEGLLKQKELFLKGTKLKSINKKFYKYIDRRALELKIKYPDKEELFDGYMERQRIENAQLENELICTTMLCQRIID